MAELIKTTDSLNDGRKKLNDAITDSNAALSTANTAKQTANLAKAESESTQTQLDTIVIEGDSSVEAAQARVNNSGTAFPTLKQRLDAEHQEVTAQLQQTAIDITVLGAIGDGLTDCTDIIVQAITNYSRILVPDGVFICSPHVFTDIKDKTVFGSGTIKLKGGSTRSGLFMFFNPENVHFRGVIVDGNVGNVSRLNVGGWDDLITFVDGVKSTIKYCTLKNSDSLGVSLMNGSTNCDVSHNTFINCRFAGVQVHAGYRDLAGSYTQNKMPVENKVTYNQVEDCGEGIRISGTILSEVRFNHIKNLKNSGTEYAIHVYTATHPGNDLALGTKNAVVDSNYIDTLHKSLLIGLVNQVNDDGSGNNLDSVSVTNNYIKINEFTTPIALRGFNVATAKITNTDISGNTIDNSANHVNASGQPPSAISLYRFVEHTTIKRNKLIGNFRFLASINPTNAGVKIDNVLLEQNDYTNLTGGLLQLLVGDGEETTNIKYVNQKGYIEQTSGFVEFTGSESNKQVSHGLGRTPKNIILTPYSSLGNTEKYYVVGDGISGSIFNVRLVVAPVETIKFRWVAS